MSTQQKEKKQKSSDELMGGGGGGGGGGGVGGGGGGGGWAGGAAAGVLADVVPRGLRVGTAREVLVAIGDECGDSVLEHLRRMLALANKRELAPAGLVPHRSEYAAMDTRADVAAVLAEARRVGFGLSRGATWQAGAEQLRNMCTAVAVARRQTLEPAVKVSKDAPMLLLANDTDKSPEFECDSRFEYAYKLFYGDASHIPCEDVEARVDDAAIAVRVRDQIREHEHETRECFCTTCDTAHAVGALERAERAWLDGEGILFVHCIFAVNSTRIFGIRRSPMHDAMQRLIFTIRSNRSMPRSDRERIGLFLAAAGPDQLYATLIDVVFLLPPAAAEFDEYLTCCRDIIFERFDDDAYSEFTAPLCYSEWWERHGGVAGMRRRSEFCFKLFRCSAGCAEFLETERVAQARRDRQRVKNAAALERRRAAKESSEREVKERQATTARLEAAAAVHALVKRTTAAAVGAVLQRARAADVARAADADARLAYIRSLNANATARREAALKQRARLVDDAVPLAKKANKKPSQPKATTITIVTTSNKAKPVSGGVRARPAAIRIQSTVRRVQAVRAVALRRAAERAARKALRKKVRAIAVKRAAKTLNTAVRAFLAAKSSAAAAAVAETVDAADDAFERDLERAIKASLIDVPKVAASTVATPTHCAFGKKCRHLLAGKPEKCKYAHTPCEISAAAAKKKPKKPKNSDDERLCVVCLDGTPSFATVPCGHVALCATCAEAQKGATSCFVCRQTGSLVRLYF